MASFLEELKKSNPLQEGINKTGAGFQLPQIQPQVPQGQYSDEQKWVKNNPARINGVEDIFRPYHTGDPYISGEAADRGRASDAWIKDRLGDTRSSFDKMAEEKLGPDLGPRGGIQSNLSQPQFVPQVPPLNPDDVEFDFSDAIEKSPENMGTTEFVRPTFEQPMISSTPSQGLEEMKRGGETFFVNPAGRRQLSGVNPPNDIQPQVPQGQMQPRTPAAGSPQANFEARKATGKQFTPEEITQAEALAESMGTTFDPETGYSRQPFADAQGMTPQAPTDGLTTQSGIPLSQFLSGEAIPEAGLRAEAPVFSSESRGISGAAGQDIMAQASAEREARIDENFGRARGPDSRDRDRRMATGEGTSMADLTDMAKANARGASPRDVARGQKVADALGVDLRTGQPLAAQGDLTLEQQIALSKEQRAGRQEARDVAEKEMEWEQTQGEARQKRMDEMNTEIGALTSIIGQAENIGGVAQEAGRQVGAGTTGFFSPLKWIGGTTAADLAGNLETIKSDAFVANITEMRQNSPTGGAVGNVSDKDLEMLQSLQTSFRQNLKPTTLRNNLKKYREIRDKVSRDAKAGFIRKYGKDNFDRYFGGSSPQQQKSSIPGDRNVASAADQFILPPSK